MKTLGVVGLGIMGRGIAANALRGGHKTIVWNRTKPKANDLVSMGAIWADSPAKVAAAADIIFEVTASDLSSKAVWLGQKGILAGANRGSILITSATLSPKWTDELAVLCLKQGNNFFDMPMTGGRPAAETGNLTLLVGGDREKLLQIQGEFKSIYKEIKYFGRAGMGMRYKLILNFLQALHIAGMAEALRLAKGVGLNPTTVGEALIERPGGVPTKLALEGFEKQPEPINFSVEWIDKDLNYALQMAAEEPHELLGQVTKLYDELMSENHGQKDWTYITKT